MKVECGHDAGILVRSPEDLCDAKYFPSSLFFIEVIQFRRTLPTGEAGIKVRPNMNILLWFHKPQHVALPISSF
jgi:hypothetical protein